MAFGLGGGVPETLCPVDKWAGVVKASKASLAPA